MLAIARLVQQTEGHMDSGEDLEKRRRESWPFVLIVLGFAGGWYLNSQGDEIAAAICLLFPFVFLAVIGRL